MVIIIVAGIAVAAADVGDAGVGAGADAGVDVVRSIVAPLVRSDAGMSLETYSGVDFQDSKQA